jgi:hypothetical protein
MMYLLDFAIANSVHAGLCGHAIQLYWLGSSLQPANLQPANLQPANLEQHHWSVLQSMASSSKAHKSHQELSSLLHKPSSHASYVQQVFWDQGFHSQTLWWYLTPSSWHVSKPLQSSLPFWPAFSEHLIFESSSSCHPFCFTPCHHPLDQRRKLKSVLNLQSFVKLKWL